MDERQQEVIMRLGIFEQQFKQLQQQLEAVEKNILELEELNYGMDEIKGSAGKEIMAPIGKGIFIKAKILSEELLVDVGNKALVKKSISETKKIISEQISKMKAMRIELNSSMKELEEELEKEMSSINASSS